MIRTLIDSHADRVSAFGARTFLCACLLLGLAQMYFGAFLPQLQSFGTSPGGFAYVSGVLLLAPAIGLLARPESTTAWRFLAIYWGVTATLNIVTMDDPASSFSWVPVMEAGLFSFASLNAAQSRGSRHTVATAMAARLATAATLVFFSYVHLANRGVIAELIPDWIPAREYWPCLTGSVLAISGISILARKLSDVACLVVATMFAGWILILHIERLILRPGSFFEWTFALTALALTGVVLKGLELSENQEGRGS